MKRKTKHSCNCCNHHKHVPTSQEIKDEEMAFLKSAGVKVKKVKSWEEAFKTINR